MAGTFDICLLDVAWLPVRFFKCAAAVHLLLLLVLEGLFREEEGGIKKLTKLKGSCV